MADGQLPFAFEAAPEPAAASDALARDEAARRYAVDPAVHVALEASAGTGKTKVLVDRYVTLLRAGVDPHRVLAITFTRKAAAEMRARIVAELTRLADSGEMPPEVWKVLRPRLGEIAISTIDAFCLALLGEFPLEADVDPGFAVADETETPRLVDDALDHAIRIGRVQGTRDEDLALLFARLGEPRLRQALVRLLDRRLVAVDALDRFLAASPAGLTADRAAARAVARLDALFHGASGLSRFRATGPRVARFALLAAALDRILAPGAEIRPGDVSDLLVRLREHVCTQTGSPRRRPADVKATFPSAAAYAQHAQQIQDLGAGVLDVLDAFRRDVNVVLARSLRWMTARAIEQYGKTLERHTTVDFTEALVKALALLSRMEEFSQSRYRLESRYQHVLVDELQDTSRAQWRLVELLVQAWGAGAGVAHEGPVPPSIFVVGDRKQSIYGFRDADVGVLDEAARLIGRLRPGRDPRRAIVQSFRAVPALQAFVNDVCQDMGKAPDRADAFRYADADRFPVDVADGRAHPVGLVAAADTAAGARAVAAEVSRLLRTAETIRDRQTGVPRAVAPGDIAILFRSRDSHRDFERELERLAVPFYVYKGLGFFDADEVKDVVALIRHLAEPDTDLHAAALLRSRLVRLSDAGLKVLAPGLAAALHAPAPPVAAALLSADDRAALDLARKSLQAWRPLADRLAPADLVDTVLHESAYAFELRGRGLAQARENLKKLRALVRRLQNRGYATLGRIADRVSQLMAGDESNAIIDAVDAVNLMTVHAAKGLEFPVVFVVNLARGTGGRGEAVDVVTRADAAGTLTDLVAVDGLSDDAGREIEAREREESKRLVYVALTRARDRLYLASTVSRTGTFAPAATSLGHVLPPSLGAALATAAAAREPAVTWRAESGGRHLLRVVGPDAEAVTAAPAPSPPPLDDFAPVQVGADVVAAVTAGLDPGTGPPGLDGAAVDRPAARARGALVHRAIADGALTAEAGRRPRLVRAAADGDAPDVVDEAVRMVDALAERADVRELLAGATLWHEVPISWREAGLVVRATVDLVVRRPDGALTVAELKTGTPRPADDRQLAAYVSGIRALLPGNVVSGRIIRLDA